MQPTVGVKRTVVLAILVAVPAVSAALIGSICFAILRVLGVAHAFGVGAVVAAMVFLANVALLALADARSESDVSFPTPVVTAEPRVHARAS